jgi:uncharacterized DUF497 family protein
VRWIWDSKKSRENRRKHGISFETAQLIFDDPLATSRPDTNPDEERWQTIGLIFEVVVLVVHTWPEVHDGEEIGRIISARKATSRERRAYEKGNF